MSEEQGLSAEDTRRMVVEVVSAFVKNNSVAIGDIADVIQLVYRSLRDVGGQGAAEGPKTPAVAIRQSVSKAGIICLEDGKRFRTLKRHLRESHGMSPEQYRVRWRLAPDYPMVAPDYSLQRSQVAKSMGLGRRGAAAKPAAKPAAPARKTRKATRRKTKR